MRLKLYYILAAGVLLWPVSAPAQVCLHGTDEVPAQEERREDALVAVRLINTAQAGSRTFLSLEQLANSPVVQAMRSDSGTLGEIARTLRFDREELLPGWRVHFVLGSRSYAISLRDARDPCGFTYWSDDRGAIFEGRPLRRGRSQRLSTQ